MTRVRVLALLVAMALLATVPAVVMAQQVPPHVFIGTATLEDGSAAAAGTAITAWVQGEQAASAEVEANGRYTILVGQPEGASFAGQTVSFRIGDASAAQSGTWEQGGASELNLTAGEAVEPGGVPVATALAAIVGMLEIASTFNYETGQYEAFVNQPGDTLTALRPNSVLVLTLTQDATVTVSGVSFPVSADVPTPLPVGSNVSIAVQ